MKYSPMRSSSSHALHGPRPSPLAISPGSSKIAKPNYKSRPPVVVYLRSPKIIHVRPEEFMGLVQQLTGNRSSYSSSSTYFNNVSENRVADDDDVDDQKLNSATNNVEAANFGAGPTRIACSPSSSGFVGEYSIVTAFDIPMC